MKNKVIGIECGYSASVVEVPYSETNSANEGEEVIFKDSEEKEEYGIVKYVGRESEDQDKILYTSKILRRATPHDIQKVESHIGLGQAALKKCLALVEKMGLTMNVFRVGYSFDGNRVHFMFTAEDRVDFRDLVKDLAKILQKQIHLRQIGPRDKAKMVGGYGKCGRPLCCSTWLGKLESIGMDMVRSQALESKGSAKLSGSCGKLLCCLKYEVEAYKDLRKNMPTLGSLVVLKNKQQGSVIASDILNQRVKVAIEGGESVLIGIDAIEKVLKNKPGFRAPVPIQKEDSDEAESSP